MASSKVFLLLGLAFAVVLLVSARELAETTQTQEAVQTDSVEDAKYGGHGYGHGYGHGHGHGHGKPGHGGHPGHGAAGETETDQN
ncbi:dormancy-associated protein 2-like [Juglans microcarpa x Juglans regia]|uniref:dormancy-associated protein 2-like n=1 Tax=Juglans microcarpa x Juglans regia TaxID=2249226 RepID=UPI001B7F7452|nr:dormancy-associated protein 2-like [Juglans microcarpa x Juglans regia]